MPLYLACFFAVAFAPPIDESWEIAQLDGARIGYVHTVTTTDPDGKLRHTTSTLDLTIKRYNTTVRLGMEERLDETSAGTIVGVSMTQFQDKTQTLSLKGKLDGKAMQVHIDADKEIESRVRWSDDVVGLVARPRLWREKRPRPGDSFTLLVYDPIVNTVVTVQVKVRESEEVATSAGRKKLTRVELVPDVLKGSGFTVKRPETILWLDDEFVPVRRQVVVDNIGTILLTRSNREAALAPITASGKTNDVGLKSLVPLNRSIASPLTARSAVFRITLKDDAEAASAFVSDQHQDVKKVRDDTLDLTIHPARVDEGPRGPRGADKEYLEANAILDSEERNVQEMARRAIGSETDPWKKARKIESFVKKTVRVDNAANFASASRIARDPRGDCRHSAVLTAGLCRAEGIPSRIAIGLLYVEKNKKPYLGFHMWTEVYIDGHWLGLDGTLGEGRVGIGHLKISDHSWHDVTSDTPLLPLARVLGKMSAEVTNVE